MKTKSTLLCIVFLLAEICSAQNHSSIYQRINILGLGYGIEYKATTQLSLLGEVGLAPWDKLGDVVKSEEVYKKMCWVNPYTFISARYYFKPEKASGSVLRWYTAASYYGSYTAEKLFQFDGTGKYQFGAFAGVKVQFLKKCYFEFELGPGYQYDSWGKGGFNVYGNGGLGFQF